MLTAPDADPDTELAEEELAPYFIEADGTDLVDQPDEQVDQSAVPDLDGDTDTASLVDDEEV